MGEGGRFWALGFVNDVSWIVYYYLFIFTACSIYTSSPHPNQLLLYLLY
jgi:hypothetical protein